MSGTGQRFRRSYRFPLLHPAVSSVAIGVRTAEQVESNVARYERGVPNEMWADLVDSPLIETAAVPRA